MINEKEITKTYEEINEGFMQGAKTAYNMAKNIRDLPGNIASVSNLTKTLKTAMGAGGVLGTFKDIGMGAGLNDFAKDFGNRLSQDLGTQQAFVKEKDTDPSAKYQTTVMKSLENNMTNSDKPMTGDRYNQAASWIATQMKSNPQGLRKSLDAEYKVWQDANKSRQAMNKQEKIDNKITKNSLSTIRKGLELNHSTKVNLDGLKYILEKIT